MEKTIIEYVLAMDAAGKNRLLMHRLRCLLDILNATDKYTYVHDEIIKAICQMDEEDPDADF